MLINATSSGERHSYTGLHRHCERYISSSCVKLCIVEQTRASTWCVTNTARADANLQTYKVNTRAAPHTVASRARKQSRPAINEENEQQSERYKMNVNKESILWQRPPPPSPHTHTANSNWLGKAGS